MKLAVIFIDTGKYLDFLPAYYEACEEFLVPNTEKTYFVFTDGRLPMTGTPDNLIPYRQEHLLGHTSLWKGLSILGEQKKTYLSLIMFSLWMLILVL